MNTKEIEERHDYHGTKPFPNTATMWEDIARAAHKDRGDLLQEVKRLKALFADAADRIEALRCGCNGYAQQKLLAELKEASK